MATQSVITFLCLLTESQRTEGFPTDSEEVRISPENSVRDWRASDTGSENMRDGSDSNKINSMVEGLF